MCSAIAALIGLAAPAHAQISLLTAVTMAQRNSASVHAAQAEVQHAQAALSEARDAYVPSLSAGSSAGYSYGFLGGVPTVFNAQIQSLVFSFSQPDYIRAARAGLHTATLNLQNALDQTELDSALDYLQLSTITQQLTALDEEKSYAEKLDLIEQDRLSAGVESQIAATRAELTAAQSDLQRLDLVAQAATLRKRLSDLTGLPLEDLQPEPQTIPGAPAGESRPPSGFPAAVEAGYSNAASKRYAAHGDARQSYRPADRFRRQLSVSGYHVKQPTTPFTATRCSPTISALPRRLQFLFLIWHSCRERASQPPTQCRPTRRRSRDANSSRNRRCSSGRASRFSGRRRVSPTCRRSFADLQLQNVLLQMKNPPPSPSAVAVTPADEMQARIEERARYSDALEARFTLLKAQVSLLRVSGGLAAWINQGAR